MIQLFLHRPAVTCILYSNHHILGFWCSPAVLSIPFFRVLILLKWVCQFDLIIPYLNSHISLKHLFLNSSSMVTIIRLPINKMNLPPFPSVIPYRSQTMPAHPNYADVFGHFTTPVYTFLALPWCDDYSFVNLPRDDPPCRRRA